MNKLSKLNNAESKEVIELVCIDTIKISYFILQLKSLYNDVKDTNKDITSDIHSLINKYILEDIQNYSMELYEEFVKESSKYNSIVDLFLGKDNTEHIINSIVNAPLHGNAMFIYLKALAYKYRSCSMYSIELDDKIYNLKLPYEIRISYLSAVASYLTRIDYTEYLLGFFGMRINSDIRKLEYDKSAIRYTNKSLYHMIRYASYIEELHILELSKSDVLQFLYDTVIDIYNLDSNSMDSSSMMTEEIAKKYVELESFDCQDIGNRTPIYAILGLNEEYTNNIPSKLISLIHKLECYCDLRDIVKDIVCADINITCSLLVNVDGYILSGLSYSKLLDVIDEDEIMLDYLKNIVGIED